MMPTTTTTAVAKPAAKAAVKPLPVTTIQDVVQMGEIIARTSMLGAKNPADGFIIAATCLQEGMSFKTFGATYHLIEGRLSMKAEAMLARFRTSGGKYAIKQRDADGAVVLMTSADGTSYVSSCIWEEVKNEPFTKDKGGALKRPYATPRSRMQMLWARAISDGVRTLAPEVLDGCYTPEEVQDFAEPEQPAKTAVNPVAEFQNIAAQEMPQVEELPPPFDVPQDEIAEISIPEHPLVQAVPMPPAEPVDTEAPPLPDIPLPPMFK